MIRLATISLLAMLAIGACKKKTEHKPEPVYCTEDNIDTTKLSCNVDASNLSGKTFTNFVSAKDCNDFFKMHNGEPQLYYLEMSVRFEDTLAVYHDGSDMLVPYNYEVKNDTIYLKNKYEPAWNTHFIFGKTCKGILLDDAANRYYYVP